MEKEEEEEEKEEERSFSQEQCPKSRGRMRSVGLHEDTRTNLVGAHWSPIDTLLPNGKTHAVSSRPATNTPENLLLCRPLRHLASFK